MRKLLVEDLPCHKLSIRSLERVMQRRIMIKQALPNRQVYYHRSITCMVRCLQSADHLCTAITNPRKLFQYSVQFDHYGSNYGVAVVEFRLVLPPNGHHSRHRVKMSLVRHSSPEQCLSKRFVDLTVRRPSLNRCLCIG